MHIWKEQYSIISAAKILRFIVDRNSKSAILELQVAEGLSGMKEGINCRLVGIGKRSRNSWNFVFIIKGYDFSLIKGSLR